MAPYCIDNSPIDLEATRVIVFSHPDGQWNPFLRNWIRGRFWRRPDHLEDQIIDVIRPDLEITCARNWAIKEHVIDNPGSYQHFLFIERDVKPDKVADGIFHEQADIVCCQVRLRNDAGWQRSNSFHAPMWRTTRSALERIPAPWFAAVYSEDHTSRVTDECEFFRSKALAAGLTIARGGWADHDSNASWCG